MLNYYVAHEEHKLRIQRNEKIIKHDHSPESRKKASRIQLFREALGR